MTNTHRKYNQPCPNVCFNILVQNSQQNMIGWDYCCNQNIHYKISKGCDFSSFCIFSNRTKSLKAKNNKVVYQWSNLVSWFKKINHGKK